MRRIRSRKPIKRQLNTTKLTRMKSEPINYYESINVSSVNNQPMMKLELMELYHKEKVSSGAKNSGDLLNVRRKERANRKQKEVKMMNLQEAELYHSRGEYYHNEGDYDKAIEDFSKVVEFVKNGGTEKSFWLSGAIFRAIANSYTWRNQPGDKEKALEYLNEGISFFSE